MKKLLAFLLGLIVPVLLYGIAGYLLLTLTIKFVTQTLEEYESRIALYFYSVLTGVVVIAVVAFKQIKLKRKFLGAGMFVSLIPALIMLSKILIPYAQQLHFDVPFDANEWRKSDRKPFYMAKTLTKLNTLVGLDRQTVIDKLGNTEETAREQGQTLIYETNTNWSLYVDIDSNHVVKAYLSDEGLD